MRSKEASVSADSSLIESLKSQVNTLRDRVKALEVQNANLSSQLSSCCCRKTEAKLESSCVESVSRAAETRDSKSGADELTEKKIMARITGSKLGMMDHCPQRYIALKVMYFGQRFYGYASEAQMDPTVESELFKALEKTRLLICDKKESQYSRCGRTDKGVSSVGQVIALFLRSKLKGSGNIKQILGESVSEMQNEGEVDYVRVLNRVLPRDIRILGWSPVSTDFSARFSCLAREYKYFFWRKNLNLLAMENAGKKFIGEHDFRNFCKMDAANVHKYRRRIISVEITSTDTRFGVDELGVITIKGSAFLWHQIRCMVAILFLIGQGLECIDVIDVLLDTERTPRKPQYAMASELPLVLSSCEFEDIKFTCSPDAREELHVHFENECQTYQLQSAIYHEALLSCLLVANGNKEKKLSLSNETFKKVSTHIPLLSRPTEPSYDERRAKLTSRR